MSQALTWTAPDRPRHGRTVGAILAFALLGGGVCAYTLLHGREDKPAVPTPPPPIPVSVASVARQDVPFRLSGIGTVQALNTVTVHSRVDGELQKVFFTEGQEVKAGDPLAQIDPRPFQAALDQATAKKAQDEAALANAQLDLQRYMSLEQRDFSSRQQADTQRAQVAQLQAQIKGDQATIDNAQVQLGYTLIRSPVNGRAGFRYVDAGNIVHATDGTGIVVVTQTRPIDVVFTLPEGHLQAVQAAMSKGTLAVSATSKENRTRADDGVLKLINNQVDQTTGTIQLKAEFPNADNALWPGEFVEADLLMRTDRRALTVPPDAVQRGPNGSLYVYVVKPDDTVEMRTVTAARIGPQAAVITAGLKEGERVIVAGQLKVQASVRVAVQPTAPAKPEAATP
ncbi:efflux RND transporter periplasmic adaptor subunit [Azospirillum canadense]|uniref:efflux RND transporter periplasmic adaptor subunit n=1 Tax=Azospirillum canadense TaxID=403962 RepID=UPI0022273DA3|nr:efflux RND transporter periplasmic adaptor subunit [Azospirillum canadense]MCW2238845.1 multidrug efflux system membrane fusion protein [Azospirillum canadense]